VEFLSAWSFCQEKSEKWLVEETKIVELDPTYDIEEVKE
jgi:hypothetical protein